MKRSEKLRPSDKFNIAVITFPFYTEVPKIFLTNFLDILEPLSNEIYAITGNFSYRPNPKIHIISLKKDNIKGLMLRRIFRYLLGQPRVAFNLLKMSKKIDIVIFYLGTRADLLPLLVAKLLNKKVVLAVTGSVSKAVEMQYGKKFYGLGRVYSATIRILERVNFGLADQITVESKGIIDFQGLNKYRKKIGTPSARAIDTNLFTVKKELKERKNLVGYLGRLEEGKGVMNFVRALPLILENFNNVEFLIGGGGSLRGRVEDELRNNNLSQKVELTGWIPHDKVADYLNELKLFVLPSYSEGLPTGVLEAMACGTPVLATPVGGVLDVIKEGETGFIMEHNSLDCIAENILRVLNYENLDEIVKNAHKLIKKEYTYEAAVERYRRILKELP